MTETIDGKIYLTQKGNVIFVTESGIAETRDGERACFSEEMLNRCELLARLDKRFFKYFTSEVVEIYRKIRDNGFGDVYLLDRALNGTLSPYLERVAICNIDGKMSLQESERIAEKEMPK